MSLIFIFIGLGFFYKDFYIQTFNEAKKQFSLLTTKIPDKYEDPEAYNNLVWELNGDLVLINRLNEGDFETKEFGNYTYPKPKTWEIDSSVEKLHRLKSKEGGELLLALTTFTKSTEKFSLPEGGLYEIQVINPDSETINSQFSFEDFSKIGNIFVGDTIKSKNEGKVFMFETSYNFMDNPDVRVYRLTEGVKNDSGVFESNKHSNYSIVYINDKESTVLVLEFKFPSAGNLLDNRNDLVSRYFNVIDGRLNLK